MKSKMMRQWVLFLVATCWCGKNLFAGDLPAAFTGGTRILFQGDSITDGGRWRTSDPNHILGQDYAYLIAADVGGHFPEQNLTFINRGVSGNTVSDLAARWQKETLDLKPDILSILIGVNDVWHNLDKTNHVSAAEFEKTYDQILAEARAANPRLKIVLCEPFILPGRATDGHWDECQADIKSVRAVIEKLGVKYQAAVVNFQAVFDAATNRASVNYWIWDGVHPTYAGHQLMADEWLRVVRQTWPKP
jgi:lysophospholipase L1-like esterase